MVSGVTLPPKPPQWKLALWARDSVEPAMLRVPIVLLLFVALWALNIWILDKFRIPYSFVLNIRTVNISYVLIVCGVLISLYSVVITACSSALGWSIEAGMLCFYILAATGQFLPIPGKDHQAAFFKLLRIVFLPQNFITFPEVLLADAMCSTSKLLKDFGTTIVSIYAYFYRQNNIVYHDSAMILVAVLASLPFWLRVRQCSIQLDSCPDTIARIPVVLNILKYVSSFPPIWLTAAASLGYSHPSMPQWLTIAATVNSIYSFLWDIFMDWGLLSFTRDGRVLKRSRCLFPTITYPLAIIVNLVLRFSWTVNRLPGFHQLHSSIIVLIIEIGEVLRRAMWNLYRIEWEVIVQQEKALGEKEKEAMGVRTPTSMPSS